MSEWIMPEWMREILRVMDLNAIWGEPISINLIEQYCNDASIGLSKWVTMILAQLRNAHLLKTPAERDALQKQLAEYKMAAAELDGELAAAGNREEKLQERVRELDKLLRRAVDKLNRQDIYEELQAEIWQVLDAGGE